MYETIALLANKIRVKSEKIEYHETINRSDEQLHWSRHLDIVCDGRWQWSDRGGRIERYFDFNKTTSDRLEIEPELSRRCIVEEQGSIHISIIFSIYRRWAASNGWFTRSTEENDAQGLSPVPSLMFKRLKVTALRAKVMQISRAISPRNCASDGTNDNKEPMRVLVTSSVIPSSRFYWRTLSLFIVRSDLQ